MIKSTPRSARAVLAAGLAMLLTGCFLSPGNFTSEMRVLDDGRFTFSYQGEIAILGLGQLAGMSALADDEDFTAEPCLSSNGSTRDCSSSEIEQQRRDWIAGAPARAAEREQQAQMVSIMLGEVDLSDPVKVEEFARKLERQAGWQQVSYRGEGIFDVSFATEGMLTHDFLFPVIEGFPMPGAFVQTYLRDNRTVRIDAPGFGGAGAAFSNGNLSQMMAMAARSESPASQDRPMPKAPEISGQFRIITNASILANNTDEGPAATPTGQVLSWHIDGQTSSGPTALLQLTR